MDTILYIDKPKGMTSFDICRRLRKTFLIKKIGHTGTLDPNATGVMILLLGNTTKASQFLSSDTKEYITEVKLGAATDTLDIDGKVLEERAGQVLDAEKLKEVLSHYHGKMKQLPPMTSAIKVNGKKLYEYQRQGIEVDVEERDVEIFDIELLSSDADSFCFRTVVSGGTYVRSLVRDILEEMDLIGTLKELRRTRIDDITLEDCDTLEDIEAGNYTEHTLKELLGRRFPIVEAENIKDIFSGKKMHFDSDAEEVLVCKGDTVLAMYRKEGDHYSCKRGLL